MKISFCTYPNSSNMIAVYMKRNLCYRAKLVAICWPDMKLQQANVALSFELRVKKIICSTDNTEHRRNFRQMIHGKCMLVEWVSITAMLIRFNRYPWRVEKAYAKLFPLSTSDTLKNLYQDRVFWWPDPFVTKFSVGMLLVTRKVCFCLYWC